MVIKRKELFLLDLIVRYLPRLEWEEATSVPTLDSDTPYIYTNASFSSSTTPLPWIS